MKRQNKAAPKGRPESTTVKEFSITVAPDGTVEELAVTYELGREWDWSRPDDSIAELVGTLEHVPKPKRGPGRPPIPNKSEILTAAALAKVMTGKYTQVAARFGKTPRQLQDMVSDNRPLFDRNVVELRYEKNK